MISKKFESLLLVGCAVVALCISCTKIPNDQQEAKVIKKKVVSNVTIPQTGKLEQVNKSGKIRALDVPKEMSFAGEPVPLEDIDVYERFDREMYVNTFWHSSTILLIKRAARWLPQISEILKENEIPDDFKYLAVIESGLSNVVSPSHAVGFWQILKPTGKELGLEINKEVDERYDPIKSTHAAVKYLKKSYRTFGSWTNVAASYNRGVRGIREELESQQVDSYYDLKLNEETSRYLFRMLAVKELLEQPEKYGFDIALEDQYQKEETYDFEVSETIKDLYTFSHTKGINYKLLKRYNPWLRDHKLTVKKKDKYMLKLPRKAHANKSVAHN